MCLQRYSHYSLLLPVDVTDHLIGWYLEHLVPVFHHCSLFIVVLPLPHTTCRRACTAPPPTYLLPPHTPTPATRVVHCWWLFNLRCCCYRQPAVRLLPDRSVVDTHLGDELPIERLWWCCPYWLMRGGYHAPFWWNGDLPRFLPVTGIYVEPVVCSVEAFVSVTHSVGGILPGVVFWYIVVPFDDIELHLFCCFVYSVLLVKYLFVTIPPVTAVTLLLPFPFWLQLTCDYTAFCSPNTVTDTFPRCSGGCHLTLLVILWLERWPIPFIINGWTTGIVTVLSVAIYIYCQPFDINLMIPGIILNTDSDVLLF